MLKTSLIKLFADFKKLYYDFSDKNSAFKTIQETERLAEQLKDKSLNDEEKKKISDELQKKEKKLIKAKKDLPRLANKYEGQLLGKIIKQSGFDYEQKDINNQNGKEENKQQNTYSNFYNTNDSKKILSPEEEAILKKVCVILRQNLIKATAEELIQKIEEEIRK